MSKIPDRMEDGLENAFEDGLPRMGRSAMRAAQRLVRKVRTKGAQSEEIVEPGKVARAIVTEAVAHSHALDTRGEQLTAPEFYYVVVPWLSYEHLYQPHMREVVRNIEQGVRERLSSDRYRISIHPHVAIGQASNLPDDKLTVRACYTEEEWRALAGDDVVEPGAGPESGSRWGRPSQNAPWGAGMGVPTQGSGAGTTATQQSAGAQQPPAAQSGAPEVTILDSDARSHGTPAVGTDPTSVGAYVTIPGLSGRYEVRDGTTIGRAHSSHGGEGADICLPKGVDDERLPYVSHVNGVFRLRSIRGVPRWSYEQRGPNTTVVSYVQGRQVECHEGESVWVGEGDRLFLSRMKVPVVFHDGSRTQDGSDGSVPPTQFMPRGR